MKVCYAVFILVALSSALTLSEAQNPQDYRGQRCGRNQIWTDCGKPPSCQTSCENRYSEINCIQICVAGCNCREGYIREDENGPCIRESDCPESE